MEGDSVSAFKTSGLLIMDQSLLLSSNFARDGNAECGGLLIHSAFLLTPFHLF